MVGIKENDSDRFFMKCAEQPASSELPTELLLNDGKPLTIRTMARGATFDVQCSGEIETIIFGEAVLATLESFLSATSFKDMVFRKSQMKLAIGTSTNPTVGIGLVGDEIRVSLPTESAGWMKDNAGRSVSKALREIVALVLAQCSYSNDVKAILTRLGEGGAFARASIGGSVPVLLSNLGLDHYHMLRQWPASDMLIITRKTGAFPRRAAPKRCKVEEMVVDLIDIETWDAVKWDAVAYAAGPSGVEMALIFADSVGGKRIFDGLAERAQRARIPPDAIDITFLVDWSSSRYAVQIGPNIKAFVPPEDSGGTSVHLLSAAWRRMSFPLSGTSAHVLRILSKGRTSAIGLCAAVYRDGAPELITAPIVVKSYRVTDSESIAPDDKAGHVLLDFLRRNG